MDGTRRRTTRRPRTPRNPPVDECRCRLATFGRSEGLPQVDDRADDVLARLIRTDDASRRLGQMLTVGPGIGTQHAEAGLHGDPETFTDVPGGLIDDDAVAQRGPQRRQDRLRCPGCSCSSATHATWARLWATIRSASLSVPTRYRTTERPDVGPAARMGIAWTETTCVGRGGANRGQRGPTGARSATETSHRWYSSPGTAPRRPAVGSSPDRGRLGGGSHEVQLAGGSASNRPAVATSRSWTHSR